MNREIDGRDGQLEFRRGPNADGDATGEFADFLGEIESLLARLPSLKGEEHAEATDRLNACIAQAKRSEEYGMAVDELVRSLMGRR